MKRLKRWLKSPRFWAAVAMVVVCAVLLRDLVSIKAVHEAAEELPGWLCFTLLTVLPLLGCPVGVLHVAAGLRFGFALGLLLVCISTFLQLIASYGLVHWNRRFFARHFDWVRRKIPAGAHVPVTVFALLVPGAPYFAQNYGLALIGIPFRLYIGIGLPMHVVRSTVAVLLGDQSDSLTIGRVLLLLAYGAAVLAASLWALRSLRAKLGAPRRADSDRTQPASDRSEAPAHR